MSTWTAPATFSAAAILTAAQLNTEIKNHLNFLKGFADLITNSTTADTGNAVNLHIIRATAVTAFATRLAADSGARWSVLADGVMQWAPTSGATDTNLYRSSADVLKTDDYFNATVGLATAGMLDLQEMAAGPTAVGDFARVYAIDNGAGKTKLMVQFGTGAAIQIAIQV